MNSESAVQLERAVIRECAVITERAGALESAALLERADASESAEAMERAGVLESAGLAERVAIAESAEAQERAGQSECAACEERMPRFPVDGNPGVIHNEKPPTVLKTMGGLKLNHAGAWGNGSGCDLSKRTLTHAPRSGQARGVSMTIVEIQELVCQAYGVQRLDMLSRRRGRGIMEPRHVAMWLARDATPHTMAVIARHFADRDPTTILYAVTQIDVRRRTDQAFAQRLEGLRQAAERSVPTAEPTEQERKTPHAAAYALASAKAYLARQIAEAKAEMRAAA